MNFSRQVDDDLMAIDGKYGNGLRNRPRLRSVHEPRKTDVRFDGEGPYFHCGSTRPTQGTDMDKTTGRDQRILRMLQECNVSAAPALLLAAGCVALIGFVAHIA
jgi:hypothetical protein